MAIPVKVGDEFLVNSTTADGQFGQTVTALSDGRFVATWIDYSQTDEDTSTSAIRARVFGADGTAEDVDFVVNSTTSGYQFDPAATTLPDGRFVLSWWDYSGSAIRARVFGADGTAEDVDFVLNSTTANSQVTPKITALSDGRFVVTWRDHSRTGDDTSGDAIRARVFGADGTADNVDFVVNSTTAGDQGDPSIAALSDGRFVVAWTDYSQTGDDTSGTAIRARVFGADGVPEDVDFVVNSTRKGIQFAPTVTALSDGRFVVTWQDGSQTGNDTSYYAIRARVFGADGMPEGVDFVVNSTTADYQFDSTVTALSDGRFVVTWEDYSRTGDDTSGYAIRARVFEADGTADNVDFVVNSTTTGDQLHPTVTALSGGRFVVTWTDQSQTGGDTSESAIRAQIFDADGPVRPKLAEILAQPGNSLTGTCAEFAEASYFDGDDEIARESLKNLKDDGWTFLTGATQADFFNVKDLGYKVNAAGVISKLNASAMVARCDDALVLSITGTNSLVDKLLDWGVMGAHLAKLQGLFEGVYDLAAANGLKVIVTGHSLGAAMAQMFFAQYGTSNSNTVDIQGINFASPGFEDAALVDIANAITSQGGSLYQYTAANLMEYFLYLNDREGFHQYWNDYDPIQIAAWLQTNIGISHKFSFSEQSSLGLTGTHDMELYLDVVRYVSAQWGANPALQLPSIDSVMRDYDRIMVNADKALVGGITGNWLVGSWTGQDTFDGSRFRDAIFGSAGIDLISADRQDDLLFGARGDDQLFGGTGRDILIGGRDWDILDGGLNSDTLQGGYGYDKLWGGAGKDYFVFNDVKETNSQSARDRVDEIKDFGTLFTADVIDLSRIDANWTRDGDQGFSFINADPFTGRKGELRFEALTLTLSGDCDGDGLADFRIIIRGPGAVNAESFML